MSKIEPYTESKDFAEPYTESKDFVEVEGTTHGVTMEQVLALIAEVGGMTEAQVIALIAEHRDKGLTEQEIIDLIGLHGYTGFTEQEIVNLIDEHGLSLEDLADFVTQEDLTDFATKTELAAVADGLADPVVLMSETAFAGITPDPGKIYIVYGE